VKVGTSRNSRVNIKSVSSIGAWPQCDSGTKAVKYKVAVAIFAINIRIRVIRVEWVIFYNSNPDKLKARHYFRFWLSQCKQSNEC